jgi:hypothetical protein
MGQALEEAVPETPRFLLEPIARVPRPRSQTEEQLGGGRGSMQPPRDLFDFVQPEGPEHAGPERLSRAGRTEFLGEEFGPDGLEEGSPRHGVVDGEFRRQPGGLGMATEDIRAEPVDGADERRVQLFQSGPGSRREEVLGFRPQPGEDPLCFPGSPIPCRGRRRREERLRQPAFHLRRRFLRERERGDAGEGGSSREHEMENALDEEARFPGSRPRGHHEIHVQIRGGPEPGVCIQEGRAHASSSASSLPTWDTNACFWFFFPKRK